MIGKKRVLMDNKTKVVLKVAVPVVFALAILTVGTYYFSSFPLTSTVPTSAVPVHYGFVNIQLKKAGTDNWIDWDTVHNTYTNRGMNSTRDYLFHPLGSAPAAFSTISLGVANVSQVVTDRCISNNTGVGGGCQDYGANGLQPAVGTVADIVSGGGVDFGNVSISKTFTCTSCVNTVINATGLYNSTSFTTGGNNTAAGALNLFAEANFTAATLQTNDQINVTWFIWTQ